MQYIPLNSAVQQQRIVLCSKCSSWNLLCLVKCEHLILGNQVPVQSEPHLMYWILLGSSSYITRQMQQWSFIMKKNNRKFSWTDLEDKRELNAWVAQTSMGSVLNQHPSLRVNMVISCNCVMEEEKHCPGFAWYVCPSPTTPIQSGSKR